MPNQDPDEQDTGPVGDDYDEPAPEPPMLGELPIVEEVEPRNPAALPADDGYAPYDLTEMKPDLALDPLPDDGGLRLGPLTDDEGQPLPSFDPEYREDFYGLLHIGSLSKRFTWLGHRFLIRTITVQEGLYVGRLVKEYSDTMGEMLAYRTAMTAMTVQQIDGKDLPIPIGDSDDYAYAQARFDFAAKRWFQFTVDAIYNEYLVLELKTRQVVDAMGKAYGQAVSTPG